MALCAKRALVEDQSIVTNERAARTGGASGFLGLPSYCLLAEVKCGAAGVELADTAGWMRDGNMSRVYAGGLRQGNFLPSPYAAGFQGV